MRWILTTIVALLSVCVGSPALADPAAAGAPIQVCIRPAAPEMTAARAFAEPAAFDCKTPQSRFGSGDFWVLSAPLPANLPTDSPFAVRTNSVWQHAMTLYALYPDGRIVVSRANDRGLTRSMQLGAIIERRLPDREMRPLRLAWHIEGASNIRGVVIGAHIATPTQSAAANLVQGALFAGFAGFALAMLIQNFVLWRALRQRFQKYYLAMLSVLLIYALSSSGALAYIGLDVPHTARLRVNYFMLALGAAAAMGFARHFFDPQITAGWVGRCLATATGAMLLAGLAFVIFGPRDPSLLDRIYSASFLLVAAAIVPMLWRAWRARGDYRWLFGIAWTAPIVLGALRTSHGFATRHSGGLLDYTSLISMVGEVLLSSLAIGYRVRQVVRERDHARAAEISARFLADIDPLTSVFNRRAFLTNAIGRVGEHRLLILDLDHFKQINDTIGHDGGDEVLRRVARLVQELCPANGLVTRLGGEEFAMLAPVTSAPQATAILAHLREISMPFDLHVTASIGVADGPVRTEAEWKALYRQADVALFEAKAAGRDRARQSRPVPRPALAA